MVNITNISSQDMINKLQSVKRKTKLKFNQNISNYYNEMNSRRQSGFFSI